MTHAPHHSDARYDERQVLHDGCGECDARSKDPLMALRHMDTETFRRAWDRAWDLYAMDGQEGLIGRISFAEVPILQILYAVRVHTERIHV